jgi:hypothetical protein
MKTEKKNGTTRAGFCRPGVPVNQRARLVEAGYPRFLFRIAAARRAFGEIAAGPRRHD